MLIVDLILIYLLIRFVTSLCYKAFGKTPIELFVQVILKGKTLDSIQEEGLDSGKLKLDYQALFDKLVKISKSQGIIETPVDLFKIACKEKGFTWGEKQIEEHFNKWVKFGCQEDHLPNYVESFLFDGKDYIINA